MAKIAYALVLALALGAASVQAQVKLADTLKANKITLFPAVVDIAGSTKAAENPKAIWTALVPTDAAVQAFLKDMGLTVDDLKARPGLAKKLVGAHVITAGNVRADELFDGGKSSRIVTPVDKINDLVFTKGADGKVTVTGAQGSTANVDPKFVKVDEYKTVHIIDKVLLGEGYYPSFAALCKERDTVKDFCNAVTYAGLGSTVDSKDFAHTVLVPNNKAFAGVGLAGGSAPAHTAVADILKYHVLAGPATEIPAIKEGSVNTLAGQPLTVKYSKGTEGGKPVLQTTFTSTDGTSAKVLRQNIYVGKSIVNGIDKVLVPKAGAATTKPAPTATTKPAVVAAVATPTAKAVVAATPTTKAAVVAAPAATAKVGGRRALLGWGWGASAGSTYAEDDTQGAIDQAVSSVSAGGSADGAAVQGVLSGEMLSEPGVFAEASGLGSDW